MAHQRLGHAQPAREWLTKALRVGDKEASRSWDQRLELKVLRQEAGAVVNK
jgi:hypothetical protein